MRNYRAALFFGRDNFEYYSTLVLLNGPCRCGGQSGKAKDFIGLLPMCRILFTI
jgi:hypothetical protein